MPEYENFADQATSSEVYQRNFSRRHGVFTATQSNIATNHYELKWPDDIRLYKYQLLPALGDMSKKQSKQFIKAAIGTISYFSGKQHQIATDDISTIISSVNIHCDVKELKQEETTGSNLGGAAWGPIELQYECKKAFAKLRFVGEVLRAPLMDHLQGKPGGVDWNAGSTMRALNIVISKAIRGDGALLTQYKVGDIAQVSANKFFLGAERRNLATSLCAVRGFYYTAKPGIDKLLLNVNSATSAFFETITVAEFLRDTTTFRGTSRALLQDMLVGKQVLITYGRGKNEEAQQEDRAHPERRVKTIFRFGAENIECTPVLITENVDCEDVDTEYSVKDYLSKRKSCRIVTVVELTAAEYPKLSFDDRCDLMAVNLGNKTNPSWFAPEHLRILPYQIYRRPVPDRLTSDMLDLANNTPIKNQILITGHGLPAFSLENTNDADWKAFVSSDKLRVVKTSLTTATEVSTFANEQ